MLGAAVDKLVRLLAHDGSREQLVAKQTLQGWVKEANRRRLRVSRAKTRASPEEQSRDCKCKDMILSEAGEDECEM